MASRIAAFIIAFLVVQTVGRATAQQTSTAPPPHVTASNRAFSPGLELGDTLYISGHLGVDTTSGTKSSKDPALEARDLLASLARTLKASALTMDDLVYVEVYCTDLSLYDTFNEEYRKAFTKPYPARDFIGVKDLLFGAHFEVMGVAVRNAAKNKKQRPAVEAR
jgi:2-iminobutanoate/2-iminopropanoate deaminase